MAYVEKSLQLLDVLEKAVLPGAYLVDLFPALLRIPTVLAPFKRHLLAHGAKARTFFKEL